MGILVSLFSGSNIICNFTFEIMLLWTTESKIKSFEKVMTYGALLFHSPLFVRGL